MGMQSWNGPRMPKERKWVKDAQGGRNGPRKPISKRMGQESSKKHECKPNDSIGSL